MTYEEAKAVLLINTKEPLGAAAKAKHTEVLGLVFDALDEAGKCETCVHYTEPWAESPCEVCSSTNNYYERRDWG